MNPDRLCSLQRTVYPRVVFHRRAHTRTHTHTHTHTTLFHGIDRGTVCPTLSSQWSIYAHPQAVAVLQVPHCVTTSEAYGQWCTVRDMMHKVRAEPLDHKTRSASLETGEFCQRTSHPPQLQVCSTCYGSGTGAPSGSHLPREGYPLKRNPVVEAPCPGPSDTGLYKGHEATEPGLAYAPVSQAHGHNHIVQCFSCCTAAQTSSVPHQVVAECALALVLWTPRSARTHHPPTVPVSH